MTVESGTKIEDLNPLLPAGGDDESEGDDHLRLIKNVLHTAFNFALAANVGKFLRVKSDGTGFETTPLGTAAALNFGTAADNLLKKSAGDALYTPLSHLTNYSNPHHVTAAQLTDFLTRMLALDGAGSGLDADLLDGQQGAAYALAAAVTPLPYTGATVDNRTFPIGTVVQARVDSINVSDISRNVTHALYLHTNAYAFTIDVGSANGAALTGTWKARGYLDASVLMQRTA